MTEKWEHFKLDYQALGIFIFPILVVLDYIIGSRKSGLELRDPQKGERHFSENLTLQIKSFNSLITIATVIYIISYNTYGIPSYD